MTVSDYAMKWKNFCKKESPSTTHEIAFDRVNGFDEDFVYVSGFSVNMIARVYKKDPTKQVLFRFPDQDDIDAEPHTLIFANKKDCSLEGKLWVGLEGQGRIVQLNMQDILKKRNIGTDASEPINLCEEDYNIKYDVRISGDTIPVPINTRQHGFCFDAECENIWFTGKLTNTVGRIGIDGATESLQHFQLPTLGAVPIYVALGPDKNVWGTCLANSIVFRVTTGKNPVVDEMTINKLAKDHRPIAIKPDPRDDSQFMWFSNEAGHSICRLDTKAFEKEVSALSTKDKTGKCQCSVGCKTVYVGSNFVARVITEFPVPKINRNMKLAGIAISEEGIIWTQSYMDPAENLIENLPDYILRLRFNEHDPTSTHNKKPGARISPVVNMTGIPIDYFELPTKNTVLHRIALAPDEEETVWFTELQSDRLGTIRYEKRNSGTRKDHEDDDSYSARGDRKRART